MDLTDAHTDEQHVLAANLQPDRVYVMDRGYRDFCLFRDIVRAGSSFVCRVHENVVFDVLETRVCPPAASEAGILRDVVVRFTGTRAREAGLDGPLRVVEIRCRPHRKPAGHTSRGGPEQGDGLVLVTDLLDVPADLIGLLYQHRWAIETFFRFFKHVLGCRHLLSHSTNGIEIQTYLGIIACLLIALWTGRKPTLRTYEMICFYFAGLASDEELLRHIHKLPAAA